MPCGFWAPSPHFKQLSCQTDRLGRSAPLMLHKKILLTLGTEHPNFPLGMDPVCAFSDHSPAFFLQGHVEGGVRLVEAATGHQQLRDRAQSRRVALLCRDLCSWWPIPGALATALLADRRSLVGRALSWAPSKFTRILTLTQMKCATSGKSLTFWQQFHTWKGLSPTPFPRDFINFCWVRKLIQIFTISCSHLQKNVLVLWNLLATQFL